MAYTVVCIPGDGTGPELMAVARRVIEATGVEIEWEEHPAGMEALERLGTTLPEETLAAIRKHRVALKGGITTPIGKGFRSVNVALRQELGLYACLRPCKSYPGVRSPYRDIDLVIVRENTEDLYAGVEFDAGTPEAQRIIEMAPAGKIQPGAAISIKPISEVASRRIVRFAFEYALAHERRKVTAVTKANIMKFTDGLFLRTAAEVAREYEGRVAYEELLVDNMCMQLVQKPHLYDGLVGGLGVAPGANLGEGMAVFEPIHGSAPKYRGQDKVNPTALILSGMLMLRHLGEMAAADRLEAAVAAVLAEGKDVTYDLKPDRNDPRAVGTRRMGEVMIEHLQ